MGGWLRELPLWCWWIVLVLFVSMPFPGFTPDPQFHRIHLIPFTDPADKPYDLVANVAMFVPFGVSFASRWRGPRPFLAALFAAGAVSVLAEATQLFSTLRFPSATDVAAALLGASVGALWALRRSVVAQVQE